MLSLRKERDPDHTCHAYNYQPLPSPRSIRLFELDSEEAGLALQGRILTANLDSNPPQYEAVSYVWGSLEERPVLTIHCEDGECAVRITQNLAQALRRFRRPHATRLLWIDTICINQDDLSEKGHYVPMMGSIFRDAFMVLVWLGEAANPDDPAKVTTCLQSLYEASKALSELNRSQPEALPVESCRRLGIPGPDPDHTHAQFGIPLLGSTEFDGFQTLLRNPWFFRAWTWQEVFVARERRFHYGDQTWDGILLTQCVNAIVSLRSLSGLDERYVLESNDLWDMVLDEKLQTNSPSGNLLDFRERLRSRRGSGCTYPSDLIYSLLGAARSCPPIAVDYRVPFEVTFAQCVWAIIRQCGDFSVMRTLLRRKGPCTLPSWVPDWRVRPVHTEDWLSVSSVLRYRATGSSRVVAELSSNAKILHVSGFLFDHIVHVESCEAPNSIHQIATALTDQCKLAEVYEPTNEYLTIALRRVLVHDTMGWAQEGEFQRWTSDAHEKYSRIMQYHNSSDAGERHEFGLALWYLSSETTGKVVFATRAGRVGIASNTIRSGDVVAYFLGADMPFILRPAVLPDHYTLEADCYLHGFMDGEALTEMRKAADPSWIAEEGSWTECLNTEAAPFPTQQFHLQ